MMKLTCFNLQMVLFACVCGLVLHTNQGSFATAQADTGIYCGKQLLRTMEFVCGSNYNKRYDPDSYEFSNSLQSSNVLPYLSRNSPISLLVKRASFLRQARGIIDECCTRSCDYNVLLSYCSPSRTTQQPNRISTSQGMARDLQDISFS